jgi:DNA-directed RNA polymerase specialized sigma24 family protein
MMDSSSDAEVIGRSLDEPEAFGFIYDRHAATLLRFLGRRAGAKVAEGLVGELFRIAFERRKAFDASRASALPWLCRYLLRPPLARERLTGSAHGQLRFELAHPRADGTTHLLLEPLELIEKIALLMRPVPSI